MKLNELISSKYIFLKYENGRMLFWSEDACGYVEDFTNAGVFNHEDLKKFCLRCFDYNGLRNKQFKKYIHFAVTVPTAIKYFM